MSHPPIEVSVIIPVYNGEENIRHLVESVLAETRINLELIVINDGSTDKTREILNSIQDERLVIIEQPNSGVYIARNAGLAAHRGKWLILLDADDDSPAILAKEIEQRARNLIPHRRISVVLAHREYEAWFIAAAESLNNQRGFTVSVSEIIDAETTRDAKGWIKARMVSRSYGEMTDQPAFSARMDLQQAFDRSRSFRKFCAEWVRQTA